MEWSLTGLPLPLILRPPSPFTDDELLLFSSHNRTLRIEKTANGELVIMTPVGGEGSRLEARIIRALDAWTEADGHGVVFSSHGGFNLPDGSTLSPDVSWVSNARWKALTPEQRRKYPPLCPDFVVEILSESDRAATLQEKMKCWINNGAQLAWMIDPYAATLTIYRPNREPEILHRPDSVEAGTPVAGFRLSLLTFWAEE